MRVGWTCVFLDFKTYSKWRVFIKIKTGKLSNSYMWAKLFGIFLYLKKGV